MVRAAVIAACVATSIASTAAGAPEVCGDIAIAITDTGQDIYEVLASGERFTSRDDIEGRLLLETARFTLAKKQQWFELLAMPGKAIGTHPRRPAPTYGAKYANWHPQWNYKLKGEPWLCWRPEWGAPFWADAMDRTRIVGFEAQALVKIGSGLPESPEAIDATTAVDDLAGRSGQLFPPSGQAHVASDAATASQRTTCA